MAVKDYKVKNDKGGTVWILKNRTREGVTKGIYKTPSIINMRVNPGVTIGSTVWPTTYSVNSSNKKGSRGWKRFKKKTDAIKYVKSLMVA